MKSEKRITAMYLALCNRFPSFRKSTRRWLYEVMARNMRQEIWTFMNYGYACEAQESSPDLEPADEPNRLSYQLYHHLANKVPMENKAVLEVGSGRGGGAAYDVVLNVESSHCYGSVPDFLKEAARVLKPGWKGRPC